MSSTNFRSILIFAICVVGTYNVLYQVRVSFYWEGSYFLSTIYNGKCWYLYFRCGILS